MTTPTAPKPLKVTKLRLEVEWPSDDVKDSVAKAEGVTNFARESGATVTRAEVKVPRSTMVLS